MLTRNDGPLLDELAPGVGLRVLGSGSLGVRGLTTALATFWPGATLPYHRPPFSEVIVVSNYDTACIPPGRPHRFLNRSGGPMAMVWVYAGDEPDRALLDAGYCEGRLSLTDLPRTSQARLIA